MKKTYIQPATLVTVVAMQQMICDSDPHVQFGSGKTDTFDSRTSTDWDEDED